MFERFTDRARRVVVLAQEEARLLNHGAIGTEHLLLGLIHEGHGVAALALAGFQLDLESVRTDVVELSGAAEGTPDGHVPFTDRAKKALELSLRAALELGHNYIGTEHLLLGLLREGEGTAVLVLSNRDIDLAELGTRVLDLMTGATKVGAAEGAEGAEPTPVTVPVTVPALPPECPGCRSSLEGQLGWKKLEATGDDAGEHIAVRVVYCRRCGRTVGILPE